MDLVCIILCLFFSPFSSFIGIGLHIAHSYNKCINNGRFIATHSMAGRAAHPHMWLLGVGG